MPNHVTSDLPHSDGPSGARWIIYTRTARPDAAGRERWKLAHQEAACRSAIERLDPDAEVVRVIKDVGSGLEIQPGLQQALKLIGAGAADAFMAKGLDRISRDAEKTLAFADELDQQGAALHLVSPDGGPVSRVALSALSSWAEAARAES